MLAVSARDYAAASTGTRPDGQRLHRQLSPVLYPSLITDPYSDCRDRCRRLLAKYATDSDWGGFRTSLAEHAFSLIYTQRAPTRSGLSGLKTGSSFVENIQLCIHRHGSAGLWPGVFFHLTWGPIRGLREKYFYGRFLGTAEHRTRVSASFLRRRCLSDGIFSGSGADAEIQSSFRQVAILTSPTKRYSATARNTICEPEFNKNPIALTFYNTHTIAALASGRQPNG